MFRLLSLLALFTSWLFITSAQTLDEAYAWEDVIVWYPAHWNEPTPTQSGDNHYLILNASTDPNQPFITFARLPLADEIDALNAALVNIGITPQTRLPIDWLGEVGVWMTGESADGQWRGLGRVITQEEHLLLIYGRAPQTDTPFETVFHAIADSFGATSGPVYRPVWRVEYFASQGESALTNIRAMMWDAGRLLVADTLVGVVWFDADTGQELERVPFTFVAEPQALATWGNNVYVADTLCPCVRHWNGREWLRIGGQLGEGAPVSLAVTPDGVLHYTDMQAGLAQVRRFGPNVRDTLAFEDSLSSQPLLTVAPDGRLLALADNRLYQLEGVGFSPVLEFAPPPDFVHTWALNGLGGWMLGAGSQVLQYSANGEDSQLLQTLNAPLVGLLTQANALYTAESDDQSSAITLFELLGAELTHSRTLRPNVPAYAVYEAAPQVWHFAGRAGESFTVTAIANTETALDPHLEVWASDGRLIAANDDDETLPTFTDARVTLTLEQDGVYAVMVTGMSGTGLYGVGLTPHRPIERNQPVFGTLSDGLPAQYWYFEGQAGQSVSITHLAQEASTLDPLLRLIGPNGEVVAENDDAGDTALGFGSQIRLTLPTTGRYTLEATRLTGEGAYQLQVDG